VLEQEEHVGDLIAPALLVYALLHGDGLEIGDRAELAYPELVSGIFTVGSVHRATPRLARPLLSIMMHTWLMI